MQILTTKALVALLAVIGIQQALALPADVPGEDLAGASDAKKPHTTKSHATKSHETKPHATKTHTTKAHPTKSHATKTHTTKAHPTKTHTTKAHPTKPAGKNPDPGDDEKHPIIRDFDCSDKDSKVAGIQELFDADCYTHLCQGISVNMNRWDGSDDNRSVEKGNGASRPLFKGEENLKKYGLTSPGDTYNSPEEWPPASAHQGGKQAILIPVTTDAQDRQKVLLNNKFYGTKPQVGTQKGDKSSVGSWFRMGQWKDAEGPYCKALNEKLAKYSDNFDDNGVVKEKPDICTKELSEEQLNGLKYDVGKYAYKINEKDTSKYDFVGKGKK